MVRIGDGDLPAPDMVLTGLRGEGPVTCDAVVLAVEVFDSTLRTDLGERAALYARAGIGEYWATDLGGRRIVRMWNPGEAGYARRDERPFGTRLVSATLDGLEIDTALAL